MEAQWESIYSQLKRDIQETRKAGKRCTESDINRFEDRFSKLEKSLQIIRASPMEYEVSSSEVARRITVCENLKKQLTIIVPMDMTPRNSGSSTISSATAASAAASRAPIQLMHESMANNPLQTERDLIRKQEYVMKQQDLALADIEKGVGRLKNKALEIGEEIKVQNAVLDSLDMHVDVATDGLKEETKHAEAVRIKGQVCYMYMCIIIEVIIILVMAFLFFKL